MTETTYKGFRIEYSKRGYSIFQKTGKTECRVTTVSGLFLKPCVANFFRTNYRSFLSEEEALESAKSSINLLKQNQLNHEKFITDRGAAR